ncbi:hypothetical protein OE88DRAFT_1663435, partial [Heliocybe sulcata]
MFVFTATPTGFPLVIRPGFFLRDPIGNIRPGAFSTHTCAVGIFMGGPIGNHLNINHFRNVIKIRIDAVQHTVST